MLDSSSHQNLLQALSGTYACIGYISLDSDEIRILHQSLNPDEVGHSYCYSTYLRAHAEEMGHISELYLERLMPQELKNIYQSGREHIELTMPDSAVKIFGCTCFSTLITSSWSMTIMATRWATKSCKL